MHNLIISLVENEIDRKNPFQEKKLGCIPSQTDVSASKQFVHIWHGMCRERESICNIVFIHRVRNISMTRILPKGPYNFGV